MRFSSFALFFAFFFSVSATAQNSPDTAAASATQDQLSPVQEKRESLGDT
jgi:hypothetical protein